MFKIKDMHGTTLMLVDSIEKREEAIVMKGNLMGTMPGTFYVTPDELWNMVKLVNWAVILYTPVAVIKGMWMAIRSKKKTSA